MGKRSTFSAPCGYVPDVCFSEDDREKVLNVGLEKIEDPESAIEAIEGLAAYLKFLELNEVRATWPKLKDQIESVHHSIELCDKVIEAQHGGDPTAITVATRSLRDFVLEIPQRGGIDDATSPHVAPVFRSFWVERAQTLSLKEAEHARAELVRLAQGMASGAVKVVELRKDERLIGIPAGLARFFYDFGVADTIEQGEAIAELLGVKLKPKIVPTRSVGSGQIAGPVYFRSSFGAASLRDRLDSSRGAQSDGIDFLGRQDYVDAITPSPWPLYDQDLQAAEAAPETLRRVALGAVNGTFNIVLALVLKYGLVQEKERSDTAWLEYSRNWVRKLLDSTPITLEGRDSRGES